MWRKTKVALDVAGPYEAEVLEAEQWNGFAIPRFTREVVAQIAQDMESKVPAWTAGEPLPVDWALIRFGGWSSEYSGGRLDGDAVFIIDAPGTDGESVEVVFPDADGCYAIGARAWCWWEVEEAAV